MAEPLYNDARIASFYDLENRWAPDFDLCTALADGAGSVLDLGCGTGELAAALAPGRRVVGVDPAPAMLAIAASRPGGGAVTWIEGDARKLSLGGTFELVLLTGHAFQVFLTEADQLAVLKTIRDHLAPGGQFIFDTRNAALQPWEHWQKNDRKRLTHPELGPVTIWTETTFDAARSVARYVKHFHIESTGQTLSAPSEIRFDDQPHIADVLARSGLAPTRWLGDWYGTDWRPDSPEIIPVGTLG
ncbi:methyltransferase family protein [Aliiruegeria haliotis]|uniref:Methyltransferase family protein n=1 Tax=Aliiruegeria haliotis TaxID=1280846 RepID=A0A2T0RZT9_9RHOB|nr:class I SAM-dependent methyltransferase [Aliiruegeria haliotis]PRY26697.1 methyltransferase family protein [Aliiruegeria haliotis]